MTTTNDPDQIRAEIERTRASLSEDVNALADDVNPKTVARRQKEKVTGAFGRAKDKVMGSAQDAQHRVTDNAGSATETAKDAVTGAPTMVRERTEGNPFAAGLIAFGAGLLVAALLPASEREREAAAA